jgi:hypothetical protein
MHSVQHRRLSKKKSKSPKRIYSSKSKSPKRVHSKSKSKSPKRVHSKSKSKSPKRVHSKSSVHNDKVKFYDLIAKKPFFTKEYKTLTKIINGKNGKRKVTYFIATNPTPRKDGSSFENWKISSNAKA